MKATLGDTVIAEAPDEDIISIEGNSYFPPGSVNRDLFTESTTPYTCPWKGECQYFDVAADGQTVEDGAFAYPTPYPTAITRVGKDFSGYVAFWKGISVS
ncbi:DUF427 domain-containing protein [Microbacterium sp. 179-B 1A2 NHS]|uniref:DUF427 domain-containing protein n=1 Tax=Microbacterium sp. 179-B 1A2 NHS TaxID=3142383 RepID=UPI0039A2CE24